MKPKIFALTLALALVCTACNMGAAGIGPDGSVVIGGRKEGLTVSSIFDPAEPAAEAPPALAEAEAESEVQPLEQSPAPAAEPETPAPAEEPVETTETEEPEAEPEPEEEPAEEAGPEAEPEEETEAEAPADNALEAVFDTPSEALSEVLAALPDQDAAQEIGAYFRGKTAQAESAGAKETVQVAYHKGSILSVTRTLKEGVSTTLRAETFHTATAGLFTLADFFPGAGDWQDTVTAAAETVLADSTLELYDGWRDTLRSRFEPGQFYLEDGRLVVYYQPGVLTADITRAAIPFDQLKGFTLPG